MNQRVFLSIYDVQDQLVGAIPSDNLKELKIHRIDSLGDDTDRRWLVQGVWRETATVGTYLTHDLSVTYDTRSAAERALDRIVKSLNEN